MKRLALAYALLQALPLFSKAQLNINGGAITFTDVHLVLNDISLQNNGSFNGTTGTITFTGTLNTFISGNFPSRFPTLVLNKTGPLQLQSNIQVVNELVFSNGLLDLNGRYVDLNFSGSLVGENETSHITGTAGFVQGSALLNAPVRQDIGNLGVEISSPEDLGFVIIRRGHQSQTNGAGGGNSILRYYDISANHNASLNATLRVKYLDAELNGLDETQLTLWKRNGTSWTSLGRTTSNTADNYVEQSGIGDFTRFTLSTVNNALPVIWNSFNTQCLSGQVRISWKTGQEQNSSVFIIRRSTNGQDWTVIGTVPAAGNSNTPLSYNFTDQNPAGGTAYYQVQQRDNDGRLTASPVLSNNCGIPAGFKIYPNPVQRRCWVSIQSARNGSAILQVYDAKGALVHQRLETIQNGNNLFELSLERLVPGMYSLRMLLPDGTMKIVKIEKAPVL